MTKVEIYTGPRCPYCDRAKALLDTKGAAYTEYKLGQDQALMEEMLERSGGRKTVPQIFIGGVHVGGCDDLHELNRQGKLDPLLKG
jgi:glutaredoxin 3